MSARGVDGSRTIADGFIAWRATSSGQVLLDLEYGPQRWYRSAWYITAVTVAVALWLLVPGRRHENGLPGRIAASVPRSESPRFTWVSVVGRVGMLGGVGWFVGGWTGLVAGAVAALLTMRVRVLAIVAAIGPLVLAGLTLIEGSLDDEVVGAFATTRHVTHEVGVALAVVWIGAAVGIWSDSGREPTLAPMSYGRRRRWPLAILVAVALALVALGVD